MVVLAEDAAETVCSADVQLGEAVGVGDVTGNGRNDLVVRDRSAVLWVYPGNGHAGFTARRKVSAGWWAYTYLGIGDVTGDGKPDLVTVGNLADGRQGIQTVYPGTGTGTFTSGRMFSSDWWELNGSY